MPELPQGTVTFAFTDIEGSTSLLKQLGDGYGEVLSDHRRLVREGFTSFNGVEIDTRGDAFFFVFIRAREAVQAAAEVQLAHSSHDWPPGIAVRMRIGLHTGEPSVGEEGYLGIDVVRAARLCSSCRGGQVLLSETTRALLGSGLPPGVSVFPLGERHLKDIDQPERVYELEIEGIPKPPIDLDETAPSGESPTPKASEGDWEDDLERRIESWTQRVITDSIEGLLASRGNKRSSKTEVSRGPDAIADKSDDWTAAIKDAINRALEGQG